MKVNDLNGKGSAHGQFHSSSQHVSVNTVTLRDRRKSTFNYFKYEKTPQRRLFEIKVTRDKASHEQYEKAAKLLEQAVKYFDSDKPIPPLLILQLKAALDQAIRSEPNFPGTYLISGTLAILTGNFSQAIKDFTYGINLDPNFSDRHFDIGDGLVGRGYAYYFSGDIQKAYDDWENAAAMGNAEAKEILNEGF